MAVYKHVLEAKSDSQYDCFLMFLCYKDTHWSHSVAIRESISAADYVANIMVEFGAPNTVRSASLIYNMFGERLFVAGRNGAPDGFEQPFNSIDFSY